MQSLREKEEEEEEAGSWDVEGVGRVGGSDLNQPFVGTRERRRR